MIVSIRLLHILIEELYYSLYEPLHVWYGVVDPEGVMHQVHRPHPLQPRQPQCPHRSLQHRPRPGPRPRLRLVAAIVHLNGQK